MRRELMPASDIRIPGAHNVYNMMMAAAVVQGYASDDDIRAVATNSAALEHRIEFVREKDGVKYYNDSIASSPMRTIAGLEFLPAEGSFSLQAATTSISRMTCSVSLSATM